MILRKGTLALYRKQTHINMNAGVALAQAEFFWPSRLLAELARLTALNETLLSHLKLKHQCKQKWCHIKKLL